jgi:hypothetical protein
VLDKHEPYCLSHISSPLYFDSHFALFILDCYLTLDHNPLSQHTQLSIMKIGYSPDLSGTSTLSISASHVAWDDRCASCAQLIEMGASQSFFWSGLAMNCDCPDLNPQVARLQAWPTGTWLLRCWSVIFTFV